jgi:hypothetical protein
MKIITRTRTFYNMQFNDIEQKLIRLGLNAAAHDGETSNSASMLFKQLRKRGITADQFMQNGGSSNNNNNVYESLYRTAQYRVTSLSAQLAGAQGVINQLRTELATAKQQASTASTGATNSYYQRRPRGGGRGGLSRTELDFLAKVGKRAEERYTSRGVAMNATLYKIADTKLEHGTLQQLLKKGMIEKSYQRCYHKLTLRGIEYYNQYCR